MSKVQQLRARTRKFFHLLIQTAGFLATILTLLAAFGISSAAFGFVTRAPLIAIMGIFIIIFSGILYILFYTLLEGRMTPHTSRSTQPTSTDTLKYPPPLQNEDFEILLKEIVYEYSSDGKTMWQRKRQQVKALRDNLNFFTDRYHWSGHGSRIVRSLTPGYSVTNQRKDEIEGKWDYFDVKFPHHIRKGDAVDFTIEWELVDEDKTSLPYLSTMIERDTKHLVLQVVLPYELAPTRAYCYVFANYLETLPVEMYQMEWSMASRSIRYDVPQPKIYHKYTIRWYPRS